MGLICEEDYKSNIYDGTPYTADYEFAGKKAWTFKKHF